MRHLAVLLLGLLRTPALRTLDAVELAEHEQEQERGEVQSDGGGPRPDDHLPVFEDGLALVDDGERSQLLGLVGQVGGGLVDVLLCAGHQLTSTGDGLRLALTKLRARLTRTQVRDHVQAAGRLRDRRQD